MVSAEREPKWRSGVVLVGSRASWPNVPVGPRQSRFRARCPGIPKGYVRDAFMSRFAESRPGRYRGHHLWQLNRLQSVLNAVARLVYSARRSEHVSPLLPDLHRIRVPQRIEFRLAVLTYRCLNGTAPRYLADGLRPVPWLTSVHVVSCVLRQLRYWKFHSRSTAPSVIRPSPSLPQRLGAVYRRRLRHHRHQFRRVLKVEL